MKSAINNKASSTLLAALTAVLVSGCATVDRVQYPTAAVPNEELSKVNTAMNEAITNQHDVLAPKEIKRSQKHLEEAKEELADGDVDEFWDELGTAQAYLNRADQLAQQRSPRIEAVLQARESALAAGARRYEDTRKELHELDESLKKNTKYLDRANVEPEVWDRALINYGALHVNTMREANLGEARDLIATAKKRGARTYAPQSLREAEIALDRAESAIGDQPGNQAAYQPLVNRADELSRQLLAVNATSRRASGQTNEEVARQIVRRNQALTSMQSELIGADAEAEMTRRALASKEQSLQGMAATNLGLRSEREWNQAIEEARAEFDENEADVYRQGDKLLIRLKAINFPSGGTDVPEGSEELLTKVTTVIEELNAKNVEVQGHTDATGSPGINKKISKERAQSVAEYLEDEVEQVEVKTVGFGFEKPIAANRSEQGRKLNRRVDVVITPTKLGASEQESPDLQNPEAEEAIE